MYNIIYYYRQYTKKRLASKPSEKNSHSGRQEMRLRINKNSKVMSKIV